MRVQSSLTLYDSPSVPWGGIVIDVDTFPEARGCPDRKNGATRLSTLHGRSVSHSGASWILWPSGRMRPVGTGLNVAVPAYLIVLRVSQCPPIESRSLIFKMPPKFTAKPVPVAWSMASAKSVPVGIPRAENGVPGGRDADGTTCVEKSARWCSSRRLVMYRSEEHTSELQSPVHL